MILSLFSTTNSCCMSSVNRTSQPIEIADCTIKLSKKEKPYFFLSFIVSTTKSLLKYACFNNWFRCTNIWSQIDCSILSFFIQALYVSIKTWVEANGELV